MSGSQRWRREGLVYSPQGEREWLQSHASAPVALPLGGSNYRVYFAGRDSDSRSHAAFVELDLNDPAGTIEVPDAPALSPGPLGNFDDYGVYPTSIVRDGDRLYMYYLGMNPGRDRPLWYSSIGVAISEDGGLTFERTSAAPALARSEHDPCLVTAPFVLKEGGAWRMWYVSGYRWDRGPDGTPRSWYHVKYAESADGVGWRREGLVCIDLAHEGERNVSRPCVVRDPESGTYRAWYAYAGAFPYRIGYAESEDGLEWIRRDEEFTFEGPPGEWETESQAYPYVLEHEGALLMLYCGNDVGRTGFGLAAAQG
jgi:hypothetical protein